MQIETRDRAPQPTYEEPTEKPTPAGDGIERRDAPIYGGLALAGIWLAVVFTSIFAPEMVTGTTQDRFPVAFVVALLAGLAATKWVVKAFAHGIGGTNRWAFYTLVVGGIWLAVALVSIYAPVLIAGTDPTRLPIAAIVAPIAGATLTGAITEIFSAVRR